MQTLPSIINRRSQTSGGRLHYSHTDGIKPAAATERSPLLPIPQMNTKNHSLRNLLTPRVLTVMLNYAILALLDMAFFVLLPVFLNTPISNGGLGMSPSLIGICLAGYVLRIVPNEVDVVCVFGIPKFV